MMNSQEEKWFESPTWNHEKVTHVYIEIVNNQKLTKTIFKILMDYLKELGFKLASGSSELLVNFPNSITRFIVIDLVEKEFVLITSIQKDILDACHIHKAYPSQIKPYMESHKGMLMGKKFGL